MRAQMRPLIDWVWLAAGLMALGGVLAATDRRYRARCRCGQGTDDWRKDGGGGSDVSRFLIPAAIFLALAGVLYVGVVHSPNKSTMQSALLGKTGAGVQPAGARQSRHEPHEHAARGPSLGAQRLGHLVRGVPRRTSPCCSTSRKQNALPLVGLDWKDEDDAALDWLKQLGNPYSVVVADRDGRTAINFGVPAAGDSGLGVHRALHPVVAPFRDSGPRRAAVAQHREFGSHTIVVRALDFVDASKR